MTDLWDALQRRDDGIARAEAHAAPPFIEVALELLREYAETHRRVFCDDVRDWAGDRFPETHDLRALGAVYKRAARQGVIVRSRDYRPSKYSNLSPKPVWDSLVYKGKAA